ncbi:hypothetical protein B0I35DRAFT_482624 [Stachybotrys elegans]|uniref:CFEM domain-containing protein n=1 Tax=Stachybotrys elegans TaxID=80388 RepID=A0A8K0SJV2_9HYPO|nr:hypothetical protein B0I35DRAFT_482624 [Stachybotrys elegans]
MALVLRQCVSVSPSQFDCRALGDSKDAEERAQKLTTLGGGDDVVDELYGMNDSVHCQILTTEDSTMVRWPKLLALVAWSSTCMAAAVPHLISTPPSNSTAPSPGNSSTSPHHDSPSTPPNNGPSLIPAPVPLCATLCFVQGAAAVGCSVVDVPCLCAHQDELRPNIQPCIVENCSVPEQLQALNASMANCGIHNPDEGPWLARSTWTLFALACLAGLLRIISRMRSYFVTTGTGWDDLTMLLTLGVDLGQQVLLELAIHQMLGKDVWSLPIAQLTEGWRLFYISEFFFTGGAASSKVMVLCLYLRIFPVDQFRRQCYAVLILVAIYYVAFTISTATLCRPASYFWTNWNPELETVGKCGNIYLHIMFSFIASAILDLAIFLMPIPQVLKLQMTLKKRIAICCIFATGLFVTACSIIRTVLFIQTYSAYNSTREFSYFIFWTQLELNLAIICSCMPALSLMFRRFRSRLRGSNSSDVPKHYVHKDSQQSKSSEGSGKKRHGTWQGFTDVIATQRQPDADEPLHDKDNHSRSEDTELSLIVTNGPEESRRSQSRERKDQTVAHEYL